jgi:hypothetical protein
VHRYARRRTALRGSDNGRVASGKLTSRSREGISGARVFLRGIPRSGPGVWSRYSYRGTVPPNTGSVVFGVRINLECCCSGEAGLSISNFKVKLKSGRAIERTFSDPKQWSIVTTGSPAPIAQIARRQFQATVLAEQTVMLNSAPVGFSKRGVYHFSVRAQIAPRSAGSGYLTLIFLDRSKTETSRVEIPLQGASIPLGVTKSSASGRWTFRRPRKAHRSLALQVGYPGSGNYWPAKLNLSPGAVRHPGLLLAAERTVVERLEFSSGLLRLRSAKASYV